MAGANVSPKRRTFLNHDRLVAHVMDPDEPDEIHDLVSRVLSFLDAANEMPEPVAQDAEGSAAGSAANPSSANGVDRDDSTEGIEDRGWATEEERQRCEVLSRHIARQA